MAIQNRDAAPVTEQTAENRKCITARVIDYQTGLRVFEDVHGVRINSKEYTLLVMSDHAPLLGVVEGSVVFVRAQAEERFDGIRGYYKQQRNEFTLLLDTTGV